MNQILRWAEDGTIPAESMVGSARRPASLRIDGAWVIGLLERREEVGL